MICNECKKTENLIVFSDEDKKYVICQRCWDEKVKKGVKNHNRFLDRKKFFDPRIKNVQI